ncbi:HAMP domain-containing histidine kinase [Heliobacterium chlorum]|uniref:histidine kinase n=1 Tax=Heliobacterium chlorum TaxID=2698 RepID=A0ABR7SWY4_HELCL|nr:ATP-binding protein [Heliobacterium chlorum]MBC9782971.1 HAMP domain-containing histidine kinase [Heliobacterium chlorum]
MRLQTKLGLAFTGVAVAAIIVAVLISNWSVQRNFEHYVHQRHYAYYQQIANNLIAEYTQTGAISKGSLTFYGHQVMMEGYQLRLESPAGELLWESPVPMSHGPSTEKTTWNYHSTSLYAGNDYLGTLYLLYPEAELTLTDQEMTFMGQLNETFWLATSATGLLAFFISMIVGRYLVVPLIQMRQVALQLRSGDLSSQVTIDRKDEIGDLGLAMNHLAESLRHQESLRKTLTADVAHELRTPISTLQGYLEAFRDGVWSPTPDLLDACYRETLRLKNLVSDLESLATAEVGLTYDFQPLDFGRLVKGICESLRPKIAEKGLLFTVESADGLMVNGDERRLTQLVVNLLENAIKYNRPQGSIQVSLSREEPAEGLGSARLSVSDTGTGIAPADIPFVFERFYRGDKSRTRLKGGSGIGLALVKAIAIAHGGDVSISDTSSRGTTVVFSLPLSS